VGELFAQTTSHGCGAIGRRSGRSWLGLAGQGFGSGYGWIAQWDLRFIKAGGRVGAWLLSRVLLLQASVNIAVGKSRVAGYIARALLLGASSRQRP
jgi:hypothetical protein